MSRSAHEKHINLNFAEVEYLICVSFQMRKPHQKTKPTESKNSSCNINRINWSSYYWATAHIVTLLKRGFPCSENIELRSRIQQVSYHFRNSFWNLSDKRPGFQHTTYYYNESLIFQTSDGFNLLWFTSQGMIYIDPLTAVSIALKTSLFI